MKLLSGIVIISLILFSCKSDGDSTPVEPDDIPEDTELTIGPEGGTIVSQSGRVILEFPAGALSEQTELTIQNIENPITDPWVVESTTYNFGPEGLQFTKPVKLSIRYKDDDLPTGAIPQSLSIYKFVDTLWNYLGSADIDVTNRTATIDISSFSSYTCRVISPTITPSIGQFPGFDCEYMNYVKSVMRYCSEYNVCDTLQEWTFEGWTDCGSLTNYVQVQSGDCSYFEGKSATNNNQVMQFEANHALSEDYQSRFSVKKINDRVSRLTVICESPTNAFDYPPYYTAHDVFSSAYLGDVGNMLSDQSVISFILNNPGGIEFDIKMSHRIEIGTGSANDPDALPSRYATARLSYSLFGCNSTGQNSDLFDYYVPYYEGLDEIQGTDRIAISSDNISQLWVGGLFTTFAEAHTNPSEVVTFSIVHAFVDFEIIPKNDN